MGSKINEKNMILNTNQEIIYEDPNEDHTPKLNLSRRKM